MERIPTINPANMENTECSIIKVHAPLINLKVGVLLDQVNYYALLHFHYFKHFG